MVESNEYNSEINCHNHKSSMRNELAITLHQWLQKLKVSVSKKYLEEKLQSHADYPSLASITDVLDNLGIDNGVYVVDKEKWDDLLFPFLAYVNDNGGRFIRIDKEDKVALRKGQKLEYWNGIGVFAEKTENWQHHVNETLLKKEKRDKIWWAFTLFFLSALTFLSVYPFYSLQLVLLLLVSLLGIGVSILIIQKDLGISNEIAEKLCGANQSGCDSVTRSKGSKIFDTINWSDAGIIYFTSFLLLLLTKPLLLPVLSIAAIPFTLFSVYYQRWVIKKWCTLCLITLVILWAQALLQLQVITTFRLGLINLVTLAYTGLVLGGAGMLWLLLIKPAFEKINKLQAKNYSLRRFKNNPDIFNSLLRQQRKAATAPFAKDLQLGNPAAPVQLMVACNPYCAPCGKAHELLYELTEKKNTGLTIRFTVKADDPQNEQTKAVTYLLQLLNGADIPFKRKVLHDWYDIMNLEKFTEKYPLAAKPDITDELKSHEQWTDETEIAFTPTVFINGREVPKEYKVGDLIQLIKFQETQPPEVKIILQ